MPLLTEGFIGYKAFDEYGLRVGTLGVSTNNPKSPQDAAKFFAEREIPLEYFTAIGGPTDGNTYFVNLREVNAEELIGRSGRRHKLKPGTYGSIRVSEDYDVQVNFHPTAVTLDSPTARRNPGV